jgi:hypothetical protein
MAGRGPQTYKKRQKEQQRKERQQEKAAKRVQRKQEKLTGTGPDLDMEHDTEDLSYLDRMPLSDIEQTEETQARQATQS